jgi:AraC family transcriptional regulator, positive regulator of tynA and feaB
MSQATSVDVPSLPQLDYEAWRDLLRRMCGRYNPEGVEPDAFTGWMRTLSVCGFTALETGCNAGRIERSYRDVRLDSADHFFVLFPVRGQSLFTQNDQATRLAAGDVMLVDTAQPVQFVSSLHEYETWHNVALNLPRQALTAHLGFEPQGGLWRGSGTSAGRLLFQLIAGSNDGLGSEFSSADPYMQLVVYDLVGSLFAPSEPSTLSRHADKLFARIRGIIKDGFADPDFGPSEVASTAGISLRYLQKLFTQRGSTCSEFIYSLRLDNAARLLQRRGSLGGGQPLSEIAYACGFRDYTHFARKFRRRFGHPPGAHLAEDDRTGNEAVRASPD